MEIIRISEFSAKNYFCPSINIAVQAVCLCGAGPQTDQLAVAGSPPASLASPPAPLALLLATATGPLPLLPLAPAAPLRTKRKPQSSSSRQRFRGRGRDSAEAGAGPGTEAERGRITAGRRPGSGREAAAPAPNFLLEDFFGHPAPPALGPLLAPRLPLGIPNDLSSSRSLLEAVRTQTSALTGAQALGVTRESLARPAARRGHLQPAQRAEGRERPEVEVEVPRREAAPAPRRKAELRKRKKVGGGRGGRAGGRGRAQVANLHSYRVTNEDGSITWGYENDDGSFKAETIGVDCVTRGKYGYTDPEGEVREYSYTSGNRCDPETRQQAEQGDTKASNGRGSYDYNKNKFVMADGRHVTVVVNPKNRARGRRY